MAETQFQYRSDLHLESPAAYDIFQIDSKTLYLALIHDIGYVKDEGSFNLLRNRLNAFRIIFLVLGNHAPYHGSWAEAKSRIKEFAAGLGNTSKPDIKMRTEMIVRG